MIDDEIFAALRKQCQSDEEYERVRAQLAAQEESLPTTVVAAYLREHPEERERYVQEVREQRDGWTDALRALEWRAMDWRDRHMRSAGETQH